MAKRKDGSEGPRPQVLKGIQEIGPDVDPDFLKLADRAAEDDERLGVRAPFDLRHARRGVLVRGERVQPVNRVGGEEDNTAGAEQLLDPGKLYRGGGGGEVPALVGHARAVSSSSRAWVTAVCETCSPPSIRASSPMRASSSSSRMIRARVCPFASSFQTRKCVAPK